MCGAALVLAGTLPPERLQEGDDGVDKMAKLGRLLFAIPLAVFGIQHFLYADPKARDTVYVLNTGFYKSTDGGKTYKTIRVPHGDNHDLWIASNDPQRMINSNDGGGNVSINGGETWTGQEYPTAQLYHVATTKDFPYHVCGAQQDNSTVCVSSEAGGRGGRTASVMYAVGGGESGYIAPHPKTPNLFYAGSQGALLTRFDRSTGHTRDIQVYPLFFSNRKNRLGR